MEEMNIFEVRWKTLIQKLVNARDHSLRTDIEIQHVINLLAYIEQELPDHKPQHVPTDEGE